MRALVAGILAAISLQGSSIASRPSASLWYDGFSDFDRCSFTRHAIMRKEGGVTLSPAVQYWSIPRDLRFSACTMTPGLDVGLRGTGREVATLWQRILQPGKELEYAHQGKKNGILYRDNPRTKKREGLTGFPGLTGGYASAVAWGTSPEKYDCSASGGAMDRGGIAGFTGKPLIWGGGIAALNSAASWVASFSAAARHDGTNAPYISFECVERKTGNIIGSYTANEADLSGIMAPTFSSFSWSTFTLASTGLNNNGVWDFRAVSRAGLESHCTALGPVYITAIAGSIESPVFDSLSPLTVWERVEWEVDQNYGAADPACACATPGSPLTPVVIRFGVADLAEPGTGIVPSLPLADVSDSAVPGQASGRYFKFSADLHGRDTASAVMPSLAPLEGKSHFSGWRPVIKRLAVRYRARAARITSVRIAPASLKKWGTVRYAVETPGNSRVRVDITSPDGTVLFENVPDGFDLGRVLDPYAHTAVFLRADLISSPEVPDDRPAILWWSQNWSRLPENLQLNRTSMSLDANEMVLGLASVESRGRVFVKVHDSGGREVATILDLRMNIPEAASFRWDGRNSDGIKVKPGTYFITATTPRGAGTRKVEVKA